MTADRTAGSATVCKAGAVSGGKEKRGCVCCAHMKIFELYMHNSYKVYIYYYHYYYYYYYYYYHYYYIVIIINIIIIITIIIIIIVQGRNQDFSKGGSYRAKTRLLARFSCRFYHLW